MANRRRPVAAASAGSQILPCEHNAKRRRCAATDAATRPPRPRPACEHSAKRHRHGGGAPASPCSSLPEDLVARIAERVLAGDLLDYVRFRAVCKLWRSSTVDPRGRGVADPRFHPRRWTMLPEGHGFQPGHAKLRGHVRFFNHDTGAFVRARVPELKDHCILDSPEGLLLLQRDADAAVRLVHPFTGDVCELPPLTSLIPQLDHLTGHRLRMDADVHKVQSFGMLCAAVSVAPATGAVTVVLALMYICRFAHASTGDRSWTLTSWSTNRVARTLGFHGSLYLTCWGEESSILRLDPPPLMEEEESLPLPRTIATIPAKLMRMPQLVECNSEILVVGSTDVDRSELVVVRLADLLQGGPTVPLTSIGNHCFFMGIRSLAVSSKGLPSVAADSIILCDSINDVHQMQYNLNDKTLSLACDGDIIHCPPPSPHSIVHHLITCCFRYFWNKGLIYCSRTKPRWGLKKGKWRLGA